MKIGRKKQDLAVCMAIRLLCIAFFIKFLIKNASMKNSTKLNPRNIFSSRIYPPQKNSHVMKYVS